MPKRRACKSGGVGGGGRSGRASKRGRAGREEEEEAAAVPPSQGGNAEGQEREEQEEEGAPCTPPALMDALPEAILRSVMAFLHGAAIGSVCSTCKAAKPLYHCITELTLANASALPSLMRRLMREGILTLRSLQFDHQASERSRSDSHPLPAPGDVLKALFNNAHKVPKLEHLDLSDVTVSVLHLQNISKLTSLKSLLLPAICAARTTDGPPFFLTAAAPTHQQQQQQGGGGGGGGGDDGGGGAPVPGVEEIDPPDELLALIGNEIRSLPRLESLAMGRMPWSTWETMGILRLPPPPPPLATTATAAAAETDNHHTQQASSAGGGGSGQHNHHHHHHNVGNPVAVGGGGGGGGSSSAAAASSASTTTTSTFTPPWCVPNHHRIKAPAVKLMDRLKDLNLCLVKNLTDDDLRSIMSRVRQGSMPALEDINLSFADPLGVGGADVHPRLTTIAPVTEAWKAGALKKLKLIDLSYQFHLSNRALKMLADAWLSRSREECASLRTLRMRDGALGNDPDRNMDEDDEDQGCWGGFHSLSRAMTEGRLETLVELDLQDNFLSVTGAKALADGMRRHGSMPCLECLDLSIGRDEFSRRERRQGAMRVAGITDLIDSLTHSAQKLKRFGLGGHLLGPQGCRALCEAMDRGALPVLEQLDLTANALGERASLRLAIWLARGTRPRLRRLLLCDNDITGIDFARKGPPKSPPMHRIEEVQLDHNLLGRVPIDCLLLHLLSPNTVKLNLSRNYELGTYANTAASLGKCLSRFPGLQYLDLSKCGRSKHLDIKSLVKAIDAPLPVTMLSLTRTHMGIKSVEALIKASPSFPCLTDLELDGVSSNCSRMLRALLAALKKMAYFPSLLSLTFTCRAVSEAEAWRQHRLANEIEKVRPWLRAYISWPTPQEDEQDDMSDVDDDDDDDDDDGNDDGDGEGADDDMADFIAWHAEQEDDPHFENSDDDDEEEDGGSEDGSDILSLLSELMADDSDFGDDDDDEGLVGVEQVVIEEHDIDDDDDNEVDGSDDDHDLE